MQQRKLPIQYSANNTSILQDESDGDDDVVTELEYIINMTQSRHLPKPRYRMYMTTSISNLQEVTANIQYFAMLTKYEAALCIADDGADTHVGGKGWLPITPISDPGVKYVNLVGFDAESAKKANLPIVSAITKVEDQNGKEIILCAKKMVLNLG